jgi:hypothetical protein
MRCEQCGDEVAERDIRFTRVKDVDQAQRDRVAVLKTCLECHIVFNDSTPAVRRTEQGGL